MMKKFLMFLLVFGWLNAGLINAVAVTVNDTAITLYDIDELSSKRNLSQNQAVSMLIDNILYEEEIKRYNITSDEDDLASYLEKLAQSNGMSVEEFKIAVKRTKNYDIFLEDIKKQILNQKLISKIATGKLKIATPEDMKLYYDNNINQFRIAKDSIQVVPFEKVKNKIFNIIMNQREQKYLKEYFETLKITADIKIIR